LGVISEYTYNYRHLNPIGYLACLTLQLAMLPADKFSFNTRFEELVHLVTATQDPPMVPPPEVMDSLFARVSEVDTDAFEQHLKDKSSELARTGTFLELLLIRRAENCGTASNSSGNSRSKYKLSVSSSAYTSSYRGVYFNKSSGTWRARIWIKGKSQHIGNYDTEVEAAKAYDERALLLGRPGSLNFQD